LDRGYNPLIAILSTPDSAPVVAATRLRAGNAGSARGAASLVAEAVGTAKACGGSGEVIVRMDSAFYSKKVIWICRRNKVRFSVTARMDRKTKQAAQAIPEDQWVDIKYPQAIWDEAEARWISDAQIAEVAFTAFATTPRVGQAQSMIRAVWSVPMRMFTGWKSVCSSVSPSKNASSAGSAA
jgi:hypothetical protein